MDFNVYPGTGFVSFVVFCHVLSLSEALSFCFPDSERPALVNVSSVLLQSRPPPYRLMTHGNLSCKSLGYKSYIEGELVT